MTLNYRNICVTLLVEGKESENLPQRVAEPPEGMVEANHSKEWDVPNGTSLNARQSSRALRHKAGQSAARLEYL